MMSVSITKIRIVYEFEIPRLYTHCFRVTNYKEYRFLPLESPAAGHIILKRNNLFYILKFVRFFLSKFFLILGDIVYVYSFKKKSYQSPKRKYYYLTLVTFSL